MIQHEHVYSIYCRPEVAGDIILGCDVKIPEGYVVVNFEVTSGSSFRDIRKKIIS